MSSSLTIREASESDLPDILKLYGQPEIDDGEILPLNAAKQIFAQFALYPHYHLYVAERGSKIVGSYAFLIMHNLGHMGAPSAVVEDVVVDPACQGEGIGKLMMQHALKCAGIAGCYKLTLSSNAKRDRAHAFYEKLGFERHGYSFLVNPTPEESP